MAPIQEVQLMVATLCLLFPGVWLANNNCDFIKCDQYWLCTIQTGALNIIMYETTEAGDAIMNLAYEANDQFEFDRITLSIEGPDKDYLSISMDSTEAFTLRLMQTIDLDQPSTPKKDELHAVINCIEDGDSTVYPLELTINVKETNDHQPVFDPAAFEVTVAETVPLGTTLFSLTVQDEDFSRAHHEVGLTFAGTDQVEATWLFAFSNKVLTDDGVTTADVVLQNYLDFEERPMLDFSIIATNTEPSVGSILNYDVATVVVNVADGDDQDPLFSAQYYTGVVMEEEDLGLVVMTPTLYAHDPDESIRSMIIYSISAGNAAGLFSIDAETGEIRTTAALDRDLSGTPGNYLLTVRATQADNEQRYSDVIANIVVRDIDDNSPVMSQTLYSASVSEAIDVGTRILKLSATDIDEGDNAAFDIVIKTAGMPFGVDDGDYLYLTTLLDRETVSFYTFEVYALATYSNVTSGMSVVKITVVDANDNSPYFVDAPYSMEVLETIDTFPTSIGQVLAVDDDSGIFGEVTYSLMFATATGFSFMSTLFSIEEESGEIFLEAPVSEQDVDQYTLTVAATDLDPANPRSASTIVTVVIIRVNDHAPVFTQVPPDGSPIVVEVLESTSPHSIIYTLEATDADDDVITFFIVLDSMSAGVFECLDVSGDIVLLQPVDREALESYSFQAVASDGTKNVSHDVLVVIVDVNDNDPTFIYSNEESSYTFTIDEEQPIGSLVGVVLATDKDTESVGGIISYSLNSGHGDFNINSATGEISTSQILDRETNSQGYVLTVIAADNGLPPRSAFAIVYVNLADVNDHAPHFAAEKLASVSLLENAAYSNFTKVMAFDEDDPNIPAHSSIVYTLSSTIATATLDGSTFELPTNTFIVDASTGSVSLVTPLDREEVSSITLTILASNSAPYTTTVNSTASSTVLTVDLQVRMPMCESTFQTTNYKQIRNYIFSILINIV